MGNGCLSLPLFMFGRGAADNKNAAVSPHDFAFGADGFYGGSYLHKKI